LICVAAGVGRRFGADTPKALVDLAGEPLYRRALACFCSCPDLVEVVLVIPPDVAPERFTSPWSGTGVRMPYRLATGGALRTDSVRAGLDALATSCGWVAIHDAARALTPPSAIRAVLDTAYTHGAAIAATPVRDTLKQVRDGGCIQRTVPRRHLWQAQTPQIFRRDWIEAAYAHLASDPPPDVTDDAMLVERLGHPVHVVDATIQNLKITYPANLAMADAILARRAHDPSEG